MAAVFFMLALIVSSIASAGGLTSSTGIGINSDVTKLDGTGVLIGMVEPGHPARHGIEDADVSVPHVNPAGVFVGFSNSQAAAGQQIIDPHATVVAEVLNGNNASGAIHRGVAYGANLYAAARLVGDTGGTITRTV